MAPTKKELIWAVVVMLALSAFAELALRAGRVQFDAQLYMPDRTLGWRLRPRTEGVISVETKQYVQINSRGFRDQEHDYAKPPNTMRIAVLGNSWTEALQVPLEKTYPSVLQQKLTESTCFAGKRVEVLNFGVAGYSTGQELLLLQHEIWNYDPDIVLVAFYPARDIANNVRELNNAVNPEQSPYFVYRDDKLVMAETFRAVPALQPQQMWMQDVAYRLSRHVRMLQAVNALQRRTKMGIVAAVRDHAEKSGVENPEYAVYSPPTTRGMRMAWRVTEGLLLTMRDEVKAHGAQLRIVVLATRPQVNPDPAKRAEFTRKLGVDSLSYADDRLRNFGVHEGIPVIALAPALSAYAESHHVFLNGFNAGNYGAGHWNQTGHRVTAEAVAAELCGEGRGMTQP